MSLDIKKEIERINKKRKNKKYLQISMILEELENKYKMSIKEFSFKDNRLTVKIKDKDYVCIDLSKDIEDEIAYN